MERNIKQLINEYNQTYLNREDEKGAFYFSDFRQINELSKADSMNDEYLYNVIDFALKSGFMIGYKTAKESEEIDDQTN